MVPLAQFGLVEPLCMPSPRKRGEGAISTAFALNDVTHAARPARRCHFAAPLAVYSAALCTSALGDA